MYILLTRSFDENLKIKKTLEKCPYDFSFIDLPIINFNNFDDKLDDILQKNIHSKFIVTSKNAAKMLSSKLGAKNECYVVGVESAKILKNSGFFICEYFSSASELREYFSKNTEDNLIYLRGKIVTYDLSNITKSEIIYETSYLKELPSNLLSLIIDNKLSHIFLYSERSAVKFLDLIIKNNLEKNFFSSKFFCLSQKISNKILLDTQKYYSIERTNNDLLKIFIKNFQN